MRHRSYLIILLAISLFMVLLPVGSYEDNTHQALTKRALEVAMGHDTSIHGDFSPMMPLGLQVIAGAGRTPTRWKDSNHIDPDDPDAGEDYTGYRIAGCEGVEKWPDGQEPLNHFADRMYGGGPAFESYVRFYLDAVNLWKQGKRAEAAFILGRALHLIEDMAQPQHAMDEEHYPFHQLRWDGHTIPWTFGHFNPSFLEHFTESHIENAGGTPTTTIENLCEFRAYQTEYLDYTPMIEGLNTFGCSGCTSPRNFFWDAVGISVSVGNGMRNSSFTSAQLEQSFNVTPQYPMFTPLRQSLTLPFQLVSAPCGTKEYKQPRDYRIAEPNTLGSVASIDYGFRLEEGKRGAVPFGAWHAEALLSPAVADASGMIVAFWYRVKDVNPNQPPCKAKSGGGSPSGENPDDSLQVKTSSVAANNTTPASSDCPEWR